MKMKERGEMRLIAISMVAAAMVAMAGVPAGAQVSGRGELPEVVSDGFYVTLKEVRKYSRKTFNSLAGPNGGPIPRNQFVSTDLAERIGPDGRDRKMLGRLFDQLDMDGNGRLSFEEWEHQIGRDLAFADANKDGRISLKELANARKTMGFGDALGLMF